MLLVMVMVVSSSSSIKFIRMIGKCFYWIVWRSCLIGSGLKARWTVFLSEKTFLNGQTATLSRILHLNQEIKDQLALKEQKEKEKQL
jgi:cell shape-determining protein MreC